MTRHFSLLLVLVFSCAISGCRYGADDKDVVSPDKGKRLPMILKAEQNLRRERAAMYMEAAKRAKQFKSGQAAQDWYGEAWKGVEQRAYAKVSAREDELFDPDNWDPVEAKAQWTEWAIQLDPTLKDDDEYDPDQDE